MNCHSGAGDGEGCFAVAGTVFDKSFSAIQPNPTNHLFSKPDSTGELLKVIKGDKNGNFYDGNPMGTAGSYYPAVISADGKVQKMLEPISTGACNSFHGITTDKIWVD